jgi:hypothetical protein
MQLLLNKKSDEKRPSLIMLTAFIPNLIINKVGRLHNHNWLPRMSQP